MKYRSVTLFLPETWLPDDNSSNLGRTLASNIVLIKKYVINYSKLHKNRTVNSSLINSSLINSNFNSKFQRSPEGENGPSKIT
ncbi:hypothetical protein MmazTMA_31660 [Methanosarcina mazei]|nr:hypothetical protein MmazTMA_31660 [Methanosarcina mazei]